MTAARPIAVVVLLLFAPPVFAWNALAHKVVCKIAWETLDDQTQGEIAETLRRHPRFDDDFAKRIDDIGNDELLFLHAGTWPDIARGIRGPERQRYDNPTWHYMNFPYFLGPERPIAVNLETAPQGDAQRWNVAQAVAYCQAALRDDRSPEHKALAYCWIAHLVADLHQPMHSTALFCDRFPDGDRGGNSIPLTAGRDLHALWDDLLGSRHELNDVRREVYDLRQRREIWEVDAKPDVAKWLAESHELAKGFAYSPEILDALEQPGDLRPIRLPESYLQAAGSHAQERIVAAGLRLGAMLGGDPGATVDVGSDFSAFGNPEPEELSYWLNLNGNVRHNSTCRWFEKTKRGRACSADEGKPCGICGG